MKNIVLLLFICASVSLQAQDYIDMMEDHSVNFYDVVKEAEKYFETHDRNVKGSGWKPYQRWYHNNVSKYFPSGQRDNIDPFISNNSMKKLPKAIPPNSKGLFENGWEEIGPHAVGGITGETQYYPQGLGRIEDFYINPNNSDVMYFVSRSGGFWKTTNGGQTWIGGATDFLAASGSNRIAVNPNDPDEIFLNIRNSENGFSHGIYHSTDGGDTWSLSNFNPTNVGFGGLGSNFFINEIVYHPYVDGLIFIGTNRGVYRSSDNLSTTNWTNLFPDNAILDITFHPTNGSIIYLYNSGIRNFVQISVDQGLSYTSSNELAGNNNQQLYLSTSPDCPDCLYVGSFYGVWKSIDNGLNFEFLSNPTQSCRGFAVNDQDTSKILYGYVNIETTSDGGRTWNVVTTGDETTPLPNYIKVDLRMAKSVNGVFYCATDGLLSRSADNGTTWEILTDSIGVREFYKLGVSQSNHYRMVAGSQDNGSSIKTEKEWIRFHGGDGMEGLFHPLNDDWIVSGSQYGSRKRSVDGGISEIRITPAGSERGHWIAPIAFDPNDHMTLYDFREHVYKSTDFGSTYNLIGSPTSFANTIRKAAIAENNSDIMVISYHDHIDKSIDGGVTFTEITGDLPRNYITDIAFDPNDDDVIIVTYDSYRDNGQKVFMTTNGGVSWSNITYNLGNLPLNAVVIDHSDASNIYVGAEIGVYTMPMNGTNWVLYNTNLPNTSVSELDIVYGSNTLRAALWGRGLWEYSLVGRNDFPRIMKTSISNQPTVTSPREGVDQYVTSTIEYDNDVLNSVWVEWSVDSAVFRGSRIPMTNTIGNTWVSSTPLPSQTEGSKLFFKVFALGSSGDLSETYKFMYETREPLELSFCMDLANGEDDVEENESGSLSFSSSDLELCADGSSNQHVGLRFRNVAVPQGATINSAYIEFRADESDDSDLEIMIYGDDTGNSLGWDGSLPFGVSTRTPTSSIVTWSHDESTEWIGNVTIAQTPDLSTIVQEIVNRPDWSIDHSMSFIFMDNGIETDERVADSHNGGFPPKLCLDFSMPSLSLLPIELIEFDVTSNDGQVYLKWSTEAEINNDYFTIERSTDGIEWEALSQVDGAGNSSTLLTYESIDKDPYIGISYYRLKQTDFDGTYSYTPIRSVEVQPVSQLEIEIFPNPTESQITIVGNSFELELIRIYDTLGKNVTSFVVETSYNKSTKMIDLSSLSTGTYFIRTRTTVNKVYKQ